MNRLIWGVSLMALLFVGFGPVSVRAFDIPGTGDSDKKKKKKKAADDNKKDDAKKDDAKKDDTAATDNSTKSDSKSASSDSAATKDNSSAPAGDKKQAAAPPKQNLPAETQEMKVPKSLWDNAYIKDMKVGDFLEYEVPLAPGMRMRSEVLEIGDHTLTMLSRTNFNGEVTEGKSKQIYSEPDPETKPVKEENNKKFVTKTFDDKIKIGDKGEFAAVRTESYEDDKLVSKMWSCKDVPLGGMVRVEGADGKAMQQLVNFGRGK